MAFIFRLVPQSLGRLSRLSPADLHLFPCLYETVLKHQNVAMNLPQGADRSSQLPEMLFKYDEKVNVTTEFSTSSAW